MDSIDKNTQLFMYLVGSFEMSAMMAMGKIKNPMTDKTEKDLAQAQFSIDILDMLKAKAGTALSEYEAKYLENTLGQLKLNFIDEKKKDEFLEKSAASKVDPAEDVKEDKNDNKEEAPKEIPEEKSEEKPE